MATTTKLRRPNPANFLEALTGLSKSAGDEAKIHITRAITQDIPEAFGLAKSGTLKPNEAFSVADVEAAEKRGERRGETRMSNRLDQERMVFLRAENDKKGQIDSLLADIQQLAKAAGDLGKEVQVATMQAPTNPGIYHRNFFSQLRTYIADLRRKVQESKHWLATANARAAKQKGFFWGQAQKSGTKFLLSQERYMVTTTG